MDTIVAENLHKRYGHVQALNGVGFSVREGEIFGLLGPNGAGKSTTIRVLATLTIPDEGRALVGGHDVVRDPNAVRRTFGYVPQDSGVDQHATGRENLMLQGRIQGMGGRSAQAAGRGAARARRDRRRRRPRRPQLLRRDAPPPRHRARARPPAARPLPRRADDRPRPGGARLDVGGGATARARGEPDDPADDALPRGGGRARPARRDRQPRRGRRSPARRRS